MTVAKGKEMSCWEIKPHARRKSRVGGWEPAGAILEVLWNASDYVRLVSLVSTGRGSV